MSRMRLRFWILLVGFVVVVLDQTFFGERDAFGLSANERMLALCAVAVGVLLASRLFGPGLRSRQRLRVPPPVTDTTVRTGKYDTAGAPSHRPQWLLTILGIIGGGLLIIMLSSNVSDRLFRSTVLEALLTLWLAGLSGRFAWLVSGSWPMSRRALVQVASVVAIAALWAGIILRVPSTTDATVQAYSGPAAWFAGGLVAIVTVGTVIVRYLSNRNRQ